jgi:hypothetical protein
MRPADEQLEKLFRAARTDETDPAMPFGFDTRVVALSKTKTLNGGVRLLQRVGAIAMIVTLSAVAGAWWQISSSTSPISNAYTIADTAIEGVLQ